MAGGLLNIVINGSQDLYLTGTPEITHFKVIYRRYTNFSTESMRVSLEDTVGFGIKSHVVLPRIGDLISKTYLEIVVPEVAIKRELDYQEISNATIIYNQSLDILHRINVYMNVNISAYRAVNDVYIAENDITINDMRTAIQNVFNNVTIGSTSTQTNAHNDFASILANNPIYDMSEVDLLNLAETVPINTTKDSFFKMIQSAVNKSYSVQQYYENIAFENKKNLDDASNPNYKFAWVKRLGHAIIDYITVYIGGQEIDKHYGDWINIWWELTHNIYQEENYFKMIGDVKELTSFDRNTKPSYVIQVPLNFWFSRFSGWALPLLAMEYHDISLEVKFKSADVCAYIENTGEGDISVSDLFENNDIFIESSLLIDYVYLDGPERRKFAQSAHEYLIDQVKYISIDNINIPRVPIILDFNHPCKEIIWVIQKQSYMENLDGHTETQLCNYKTLYGKNPLKDGMLELNGHERIAKIDGAYFNYVRPYCSHKDIPDTGINLYSFALVPEENQPSGSCNFSRLSKTLLTLDLEPSVFTDTISDPSGNNIINDLVNIRVYAVIHNVLRIIGGMGALAFS